MNIFEKIISRLASGLYIDANGKAENTVLIAGSGRGGTTWLSEMINANNDYRYMFEPLNPERVQFVEHFNTRQFISSNSDLPIVKEALDAIVRGKVRGYWIDQYNSKFFIVKNRLIKVIRGNLLTHYVHVRYPDIPIIFNIRNPYATVVSQISQGWEANLKEVFLSQNDLIKDFLYDKLECIKQATTPFEIRMTCWAIENYVPLCQFKPDDIHFCFYENLVADPQKEFLKLYDYLSLDYKDFDNVNASKPSQMSGKGSAIASGDNLLTWWKDRVSVDEYNTGQQILSVFGLENLYDENGAPNTNELERILLKDPLYIN